MEPVTHFLTGACIGRAGLNRLTAYATLAATLGAEAPDMDVVWIFAGPVEGLAHHRGILHTFIAAPFMATVLTGLIWILHNYVFSRRRSIRDPQPVRWLWVWLSAFIAHFTHLLLDWTNNYGVRAFFPFNARWYSGDLVYIADPILWALLLAAVLLPLMLGLTDREIGARRTQFRGRGWAVMALSGMVVLWCWRWAEHAHGLNLVKEAQVTTSSIRRVALEPYPMNPFRWHALIETGSTWQTAEVNTRRDIVVSDPRIDTIFKQAPTPASEFARRTRLGQVYLDWSQWPVVRDLGAQEIAGYPAPALTPGRQFNAVEFSDLRFAYAYLDTAMAGSSNQKTNQMLIASGITGWVYVIDGKEDAGQFLYGHEQK